MTDSEQAIFNHLADRQGEMLDLLERIVSIDSQSRDKAGVGDVSGAIADFLRAHDVPVESVPNATYGDGLRAVVAPAGSAAARPIVVMGHCDTVFPKGEAARRPFHVRDSKAFGPGVADMKGGLVMNAFVLAALAQTRAASLPVIGLFTVDEEIASPWSRTVIQQTCEGARAVFNSEPGRPNGNIVTSRNGGLFFRIEIEGKAAHSGINFATGISAIGEAARKIVAIEGLTDLPRGVTANAGLVGGGSAFNIVAPNAFVEAEVRYREWPDREIVRENVERIVAESHVPGSRSELIVHGEFPPMEASAATNALFDCYQDAVAEAGYSVEGEFSGGCSDAGFAAGMGAPTLCAVGPIGGKQHTDEEYLDVETLVPRAQAMALAIARWPLN